ncbi:hypothetical protein C9374_006649 [Naegleria lovaniensis]|uniref:BZIP domain-containing protein n=1 Tax=Naegleria lovaniensis TaxID=51637 RepID=A0AA88GLD2_NAELO|nr:uncharacterized protein C9374_006649 [Naegleria lovaniensis]KAG2379532.1 hypothetical protein C9374_006649 [Naegleria lovaniensis]
MSCSSPTNFDDFESLFSEQNEGLESLYQSPTGTSMASSNSSGTDHSSSTQQQEPITYDVLSDGYAFGLNEFDLSPQLAQKQKTGDLAAANPFFTQTANNNNGTANAFNPLTGFVYPTNATNNATKNAFGATTAFNPQFPMNQLGMYFPQAFPFPQFGGQPFPSCFPNTLAFSSPNTSPIMPGTLNTSPINNTTTSPNNTTTTSNTESGKTKTARRKTSNSKKNTKSSASNNNQTSPTDSGNDTLKATSPSDSVAQTATTNSATTPESVDSGVSSHSDNDSASSSGKKSSDNEKKRKRKTKGGTSPKPEKTLTPEEEKEMKRQRRLIKNRESAQASRERKKVYIQGLEKKVDGLAQENSDLQNHCSVLEQENEILRQRLKMLGEVVEEPTTKKRKMTPFAMKVPIPSNPFMLDFWSLFGMGQCNNNNKFKLIQQWI